MPVQGISVAELAQAMRNGRGAGPHKPGDLAAAASPELPQAVLARLPQAEIDAMNNARLAAMTLHKTNGAELLRLLGRRALEPRLGGKERVRRLRLLFDAWSAPILPHSACRRGCSHCCHIAVAVHRSEAQLISEETGVAIAPAMQRESLGRSRAADAAQDGLDALNKMHERVEELAQQPQRCTFLGDDNRCTIYASRPLACRQLMNMDVDDLLCRIIPGAEVPVPYADATELQALAAAAMADLDVADIRQWFPAAMQAAAKAS